jgi:plasmid stabilization system protein ParE
MTRIIRSPQAQRDVVQIWAHIAADNMRAADKLIDTFDQKLNILKDFPGMGQLREELASKLRSLPVGNYLFFIVRSQMGLNWCGFCMAHGI